MEESINKKRRHYVSRFSTEQAASNNYLANCKDLSTSQKMDEFLTEFSAYEDFLTERAEWEAEEDYFRGRKSLSLPKKEEIFITEWTDYSDFLYWRNFPNKDGSYNKEESIGSTTPLKETDDGIFTKKNSMAPPENTMDSAASPEMMIHSIASLEEKKATIVASMEESTASLETKFDGVYGDETKFCDREFSTKDGKFYDGDQNVGA